MEGLQNYMEVIEDTSNIKWLQKSMLNGTGEKISAVPYTIPTPGQPTHAMIYGGSGAFYNLICLTPDQAFISGASFGTGAATVKLTSSGVVFENYNGTLTGQYINSYVIWEEKQ